MFNKYNPEILVLLVVNLIWRCSCIVNPSYSQALATIKPLQHPPSNPSNTLDDQNRGFAPICGITKKRSNNDGNRIAGGMEATPNEFPWQAFLEIYIAGFPTAPYVCGGSLISNQWILTTATCVDKAVSINVYLGAHNINALSESSRMMYTTNTYYKNPGWLQQNVTADIALVKLPTPINIIDEIRPICLPTLDDPSHEGDLVYLSGWGRTSGVGANGPLSSILRKTTATVISNVECKNIYGGIISNATICSSGQFGKGICQGDIGGPMSYANRDDIYSQIGIASFHHISGCSTSYPSGFTRVRNYLDWISVVTDIPIPNSSSRLGEIYFGGLLNYIIIALIGFAGQITMNNHFVAL